MSQRVAEDSVFDVALDLGEGGFRLGEFVFGRFGGEELYELRIVYQALEHGVVRQRQVVYFDTGIVPGGDIA